MFKPNKLHISTLTNEWCDKDIVMLHACFQLLTDCIEKEKLISGEHTDWDYDETYRNAKKEIEELYTWWQEWKKNEEQGKLDTLEKAQYNQDNEMLIRLIKVREFLWT